MIVYIEMIANVESTWKLYFDAQTNSLLFLITYHMKNSIDLTITKYRRNQIKWEVLCNWNIMSWNTLFKRIAWQLYVTITDYNKYFHYYKNFIKWETQEELKRLHECCTQQIILYGSSISR